MINVTSAEGLAILNKGCLALSNVKTKPEGFVFIKPSRSYASFSDLEITKYLDIFSFSHKKLFHNDAFDLGLLAKYRVNIGLKIGSTKKCFCCLHIN